MARVRSLWAVASPVARLRHLVQFEQEPGVVGGSRRAACGLSGRFLPVQVNHLTDRFCDDCVVFSKHPAYRPENLSGPPPMPNLSELAEAVAAELPDGVGLEAVEYEIGPCSHPNSGGSHCPHVSPDQACCWCGEKPHQIKPGEQSSTDDFIAQTFSCREGLHAFKPDDAVSPAGTDCKCGKLTMIGVVAASTGQRQYFIQYLIGPSDDD